MDKEVIGGNYILLELRFQLSWHRFALFALFGWCRNGLFLNIICTYINIVVRWLLRHKWWLDGLWTSHLCCPLICMVEILSQTIHMTWAVMVEMIILALQMMPLSGTETVLWSLVGLIYSVLDRHKTVNVLMSAPEFFDISQSARCTYYLSRYLDLALKILLVCCQWALPNTMLFVIGPVNQNRCVVATQVRPLGLAHFPLQPR